MSEKDRKTRDKKRNTVIVVAVIVIGIIALIGLISIGMFGGCKILGYDIDISKPDPMNAPQSALLNSPNNQYHILQQVDNPNDFWQAVEKIESSQNVETIYYTAVPYQRSDGTWGNVYCFSYKTH